MEGVKIMVKMPIWKYKGTNVKLQWTILWALGFDN